MNHLTKIYVVNLFNIHGSKEINSHCMYWIECRVITLKVYRHIKVIVVVSQKNDDVVQIVFTIDENNEIIQTTPIVCYLRYVSILKCLNWISQWISII